MNKTRNILSLLFIVFMVFFLHSCKTKSVTADAYVTNYERLEYYKPLTDSKKYQTKIFAVANINALYKAAANFRLNDVFFKNVENDSIYRLKNNLNKFYSAKATDNATDIQNNLVPAEPEDLVIFEKVVTFVSSNEYTKQVFSSDKKDRGYWDIYLITNTAVRGKNKNYILPINKINNINELIILDLSVNKED